MITWPFIAVFLFHLLVAFGLAYVVGMSEITEPLRTQVSEAHFWKHGSVRCDGCAAEFSVEQTWNERTFTCPGCKGECRRVVLRDPFLLRMLECPACFGFWIGLAFGFIYVPSALGLEVWAALLVAPLFGLATLGSNLILAKNTGLMP